MNTVLHRSLLGVITLASLTGTAALVGGCASKSSKAPILTLPSDADLRQAMALATRGQEALKRGDHDQAIESLRAALKLRSDLGSAWNNLGLALQARGTDLDYMQAIEAFKRAADQLPMDERPYQNLDLLYHERGFSDEALRYYGQSLERNENNLESLRGAIVSAKLLLRSDEAGLQRVNRALLIETDEKWREIHRYERLRIQHDLAERHASPSY